MKRALSFVVPTDRETAQPEGPQPVVHFFEPEVLIDQRLAEEADLPAPRDTAVAVDGPHLEVRGIVERRQARGQRARRRFIQLGRDTIVQGFMRALVVVFPAEAIEAALWARRVAAAGLAVSAFKTA